MDAFIVSTYIKKSLQSNKKNLEHAAFIIDTPNSEKINQEEYQPESIIQNNPEAFHKINPNIDNGVDLNNNIVSESSENNLTELSNTENSNNITVNHIKVMNVNTSNKKMSVEDEEEEYLINNKANKVSSITFLLMLLINSYSAYLSWECNSAKGYPLALKIVFSFFAFIFGTMYLLYYILFRFDECNTFIRK